MQGNLQSNVNVGIGVVAKPPLCKYLKEIEARDVGVVEKVDCVWKIGGCP